MDQTEITIRLAGRSDGPAIRRLAERDSAAVPAGRLLIAERAARPIAAIALASGAEIADPFTRTATALELLRVRSRQLSAAEPRRRRLPRLGRPRRRLAGAAARPAARAG